MLTKLPTHCSICKTELSETGLRINNIPELWCKKCCFVRYAPPKPKN